MILLVAVATRSRGCLGELQALSCRNPATSLRSVRLCRFQRPGLPLHVLFAALLPSHGQAAGGAATSLRPRNLNGSVPKPAWPGWPRANTSVTSRHFK